MSRLETIVQQQLSVIAKRLEAATNELHLPPYIAAVAFGSCTTPEVTKHSDIDVEILYDPIPPPNEFLPDRLRSVSQQLTNDLKRAVHLWPKPLSSYLQSGPFSSTPNEDFLALDGWDGMDSNGLRFFIKQTGKVISGDPNVLERMWLPSTLSARDAYERLATSTMYLAKGLAGDQTSMAKAILRAQSARLMLQETLPATYGAIAQSAIGTEYESLLRHAYAAKVVSQQGLFRRIQHLFKHHEWPRKHLRNDNKDIIQFFIDTKEKILNERADNAPDDEEQLHRDRTALHVVEALHKQNTPNDFLFYLFGKEMVEYQFGTELELDDKIDIINPKNIGRPLRAAYERLRNVTLKQTAYTSLEKSLLADFLIPYAIRCGERSDEAKLLLDNIAPHIGSYPLTAERLALWRLQRLTHGNRLRKEDMEEFKNYARPTTNCAFAKELARASPELFDDQDLSKKTILQSITHDPTNITTILNLCNYVSSTDAHKLLLEAKKRWPNHYRIHIGMASVASREIVALSRRMPGIRINSKSTTMNDTNQDKFDTMELILQSIVTATKLLEPRYNTNSWQKDRNSVKSDFLLGLEIFARTNAEYLTQQLGPQWPYKSHDTLAFAHYAIDIINKNPEWILNYFPRTRIWTTYHLDCSKEFSPMTILGTHINPSDIGPYRLVETRAHLYEIAAAALRNLTPRNSMHESINFKIIREYLATAAETWNHMKNKKQQFWNGYQELQLRMRENDINGATQKIDELFTNLQNNNYNFTMQPNIDIVKGRLLFVQGRHTEAEKYFDNVMEWCTTNLFTPEHPVLVQGVKNIMYAVPGHASME